MLTWLQRLLSGLSVKSVIQQPSVRAAILRKDVFIDTRNYWSALHMKVLSDLLGGSLSTEIALTIFLCLKPNTVLLIDSCCFNSWKRPWLLDRKMNHSHSPPIQHQQDRRVVALTCKKSCIFLSFLLWLTLNPCNRDSLTATMSMTQRRLNGASPH